MDEFNTPATFAQYSKMQRQVQQLSYKIVELEKLERNSGEDNAYQDEEEQAEAADTNLLSKATVAKIVAYTALVVVGTFFEVCHVPDQLAVFPLSLLLDGRNYASGATIVLLSVILA